MDEQFYNEYLETFESAVMEVSKCTADDTYQGCESVLCDMSILTQSCTGISVASQKLELSTGSSNKHVPFFRKSHSCGSISSDTAQMLHSPSDRSLTRFSRHSYELGEDAMHSDIHSDVDINAYDTSFDSLSGELYDARERFESGEAGSSQASSSTSFPVAAYVELASENAEAILSQTSSSSDEPLQSLSCLLGVTINLELPFDDDERSALTPGRTDMQQYELQNLHLVSPDNHEAKDFAQNRLRLLKCAAETTSTKASDLAEDTRQRVLLSENNKYSKCSEFFRVKIDHLWQKNDNGPVVERSLPSKPSCGGLQWKQTAIDDYGLSSSVISRLRTQNTLNRIQKACDIHERNICEQCQNEDESLTLKDFIRAKTAVLSEKMISDRIANHIIAQDTLTQLGETLSYLTYYQKHPDQVMKQLLRPLTEQKLVDKGTSQVTSTF